MAKTKKAKPAEPSVPEPISIPIRNNPAARRWLWIWVSFFTVLIVGLWGWAAKISLGSFKWNQTPEKQIIDSRQEDWDKLFNSESDRIKNERIKSQLKNVLNQIMAEVVSSTSATTTASTTVSVTTTPITTSSTSSTR